MSLFIHSPARRYLAAMAAAASVLSSVVAAVDSSVAAAAVDSSALAALAADRVLKSPSVPVPASRRCQLLTLPSVN